MAAGARISLQNWGRRLGRSCITGLTGRGSSRSVSTHVQGKGALLEKSFVLSSLSVLAIGAYRWKSRHAVIYASIKVEDVKEEADYLYGAAETEKLYELLSQYGDSTDAEILWRLARASRDLAQLSKTPPDDKKRLVYEAREFAKKALEINESCSAAHKWYAICLSDVGDYEGMKVKIGNAYIIRDHFQRAIELNPNDATTIHLIGVWCYTFADLPWYQNKIAAALFATPPSSTFDEALIYFEMAEEVDPNFYSKNLLYLGKTFLKLKNNELALQWLQKAKDYPVRTEEDKAVYKEATDILKSYGVKV
ncbi:regulator of microtubule dynamics protein 1 isoform X2 [Hyla sarda]|uniref:regulator of microtubule dynamics protein 1 isoform X2 n=1 Tax=Hyla sarda TaxID=327740 RepID=UPI0024C32560|nr:regulator of microtubule dynamics protein 1 isoform X2 [Hyla sarda]